MRGFEIKKLKWYHTILDLYVSALFRTFHGLVHNDVVTRSTSSSRPLAYKFQLPASGLSAGYKLRSCKDKGEHLLAALGLDLSLLAGIIGGEYRIRTDLIPACKTGDHAKQSHPP